MGGRYDWDKLSRDNKKIIQGIGIFMIQWKRWKDCTDKKEKKIFLIYKENSEGSGAKSYMTNGLLKCSEKFAHFLIY